MSELEMLSPGIRRYFRLRSISKSWRTPQLYNLTHCCPVKSGAAAFNGMILNAVLAI